MTNLKLEGLVPLLNDDVFQKDTVDVTTSFSTEGSDFKPVDTIIDEDDLDNSQDNEPARLEGIEKTEPQNTQPSDNEVPTALYEEMVKHGLAAPIENKENYTWEDIESTFTTYKNELPAQIAEQLITSAPALGQKIIDYIFTKGQDLKEDDLKSFVSEYITDISSANTSVDLNNTDQVRSYLATKYKDSGVRASQIEVMLDALEDESETALKEEASKFIEKDKSSTKTDAKLSAAKEEVKNREENTRKFVENINKEFETLEWKPTRINKIKQNLATGKTNEVFTKASSRPKAVIQLADLADYFDEAKGEFNFDAYIKQALSQDNKNLRDRLSQKSFSTTSNTTERTSSPIVSRLQNLRPVSPLK